MSWAPSGSRLTHWPDRLLGSGIQGRRHQLSQLVGPGHWLPQRAGTGHRLLQLAKLCQQLSAQAGLGRLLSADRATNPGNNLCYFLLEECEEVLRKGWYVVIIESCKRSIKKTHVRQPKGHFCLWLLATLSPEPVCCISINHENMSMCFHKYSHYHFTGNILQSLQLIWYITEH